MEISKNGNSKVSGLTPAEMIVSSLRDNPDDWAPVNITDMQHKNGLVVRPSGSADDVSAYGTGYPAVTFSKAQKKEIFELCRTLQERRSVKLFQELFTGVKVISE